tara:strand:+ start:320 stop:871 length:552 start_codon:yes stop_codon:yes gene_type:complete
MKQYKSEMPFIWKPEGDCRNSKEKFFLRASKSQKTLIAARLGFNLLKSLEVKILISHKDDDVFLLHGHINAEICKTAEESNELVDFVIDDEFQEKIQLNVPEDQLEFLANEEDNITEFYTSDTIDLGEISVQNLSLLLDDICYDFQDTEYSEEMRDSSKEAKHRPFSSLASLLNEKMDAKTRR